MTDEQSVIEPTAATASEPGLNASPPETATMPPPGITMTAPSEPGPANPAPDGSMVAYLQADQSGQARLWLASLDGAAPRALETDPALILLPDDPDEGPQWSPDSTRLAVVGQGADSDRRTIWIVPVEEGEARPLRETATSTADRAPRWSPDGERIAFIATREGRDLLCVVPVAGGGTVQLTDGRHDAREPVWAPEGDRIAFIERSQDDEQPAGIREDICTVQLDSGEVKRLTTKAASGRRSPRWATHRAVIAYVTEDREWAHIAVVNPDNGSGWTTASEVGDKADPQWSPTGKLLYTRTDGLTVRCCVRNTNAARADAIDPSDGVARSPRWLPIPPAPADGYGEQDSESPAETAERAIYLFGSPVTPSSVIVQEPEPDAEWQTLPIAIPWEAPRTLVTPTRLDFVAGSGSKVAGLLYRRSELSGPAPGAVVVDDAPFGHRTMTPRPPEQTLAAAGLAVFAPHLHGAPGFGRKVADGLRLGADAETEVSDLADAAAALAGAPDVMGDRIAVVGQGYGGTLALLLAGGRPGIVGAVVAIDPIADWEVELDQSSGEGRSWLLERLGLPVAHRARYELRTPATFAAPIDVPLLLIATASAPPWRRSQLDALIETLTEYGVAFERETVETGADAATEPFRRAAAFLGRVFAS
jgi:dipeptidyl aminopeptidase/acylaminoacyl peptidase